jgi:holo-[acyl-carrier protein] synthase
VFTDEERDYCLKMAHPHKHLAARFAAKEAVSKCFTTGIGAELGWRSVSVYHGERNQPFVRLDARGEALLREVGATHVLLTLSHTETVAMAVAALVRV